MPVFAGGPDSPRRRLRRLPFLARAAHPAAGWSPGATRSTSAARTVLGFVGLLLILFVAAFAVGRQAGPVAPDLHKPGPPGAPVPMGDEGGGHGRMGLGEPAGAVPAFRAVGGAL
ncbi:hypothetical protein ACIBSV_01625 [Embleya sp. NPDC050154]|uniref:hypothetical protein n=1 Tax=Embleya sp. NPDC050154 TaxID=3363988 RepID=UPI0037B90D9F